MEIELMDIENRIEHLDMAEPLLAKWVTGRIENLNETDPEAGIALCRRCLTPDKLRVMINKLDYFSLRRLFGEVPADLFAGNTEDLIRKWPTWTEPLPRLSAAIVAHNDPQAALRLFAEQYDGDIGRLLEADQYFDAMSLLEHIHNKEGQDLASQLITSFAASDHSDMINTADFWKTLQFAWQLQHPEFKKLLKKCLFNNFKGKKEEFRHLYGMVFDVIYQDHDEYGFICRRLQQKQKPNLDYFVQLYQRDLPAGQLEMMITRIKQRQLEPVLQIIESNLDWIRDDRFRELWRWVLDQPVLIKELHKKKQRPYFLTLLLAGVLAGGRKNTIDWKGLTLEEKLALITTDVRELPDYQGLVAELSQHDRKAVVNHLVAALDTELEHSTVYHAISRIINLMAELGDSVFIAPLHGLLDMAIEHSPRFTLVQHVLTKFGDRVLEHWQDKMEGMTDAELISVAITLTGMKSAVAVDFLERYFERLWRAEKEFVLYACEALPGGPWIQRLAPLTGKGQNLIDATYLTLQLLNGRLTGSDRKLLENYSARQAELDSKQAELLTGNFSETVDPTIDLDLKCTACGQTGSYTVNRVIINPQAEDRQPFIAQEITCINCDLLADFELTSMGHMKIMGAMLHLMAAANAENQKQVLEESPLDFATTLVQGRVMGTHEGIAHYRAELEKHPAHPELLIGLANIYRNAGHPSKATTYYRQALDIDSGYLESSYNLAYMALDEGRPQEALAILKQGPSSYSQAKVRRNQTDHTKQDLVDAHNALIASLMDPEENRMPSPPSAPVYEPKAGSGKPKKIGRNSPCPCGSGRKYKKCCLAK